MVADALDEIPPELGEEMENVAVVVEDWPNAAQLARVAPGGTLLGLYEGVPLTRRGPLSYAGVAPDRITIFRGPLSRIARDEDDLACTRARHGAARGRPLLRHDRRRASASSVGPESGGAPRGRPTAVGSRHGVPRQPDPGGRDARARPPPALVVLLAEHPHRDPAGDHPHRRAEQPTPTGSRSTAASSSGWWPSRGPSGSGSSTSSGA